MGVSFLVGVDGRENRDLNLAITLISTVSTADGAPAETNVGALVAMKE
jgi:hypothetical protein